MGLNGRVQEVMLTVLVCSRIWKSEASAADRKNINKQVSSKDRRERNWVGGEERKQKENKQKYSTISYKLKNVFTCVKNWSQNSVLTVHWEVTELIQVNKDTEEKILLPRFLESVFIREFSGEIPALELLFPDTEDDALSQFVSNGNNRTKRTEILKNEWHSRRGASLSPLMKLVSISKSKLANTANQNQHFLFSVKQRHHWRCVSWSWGITKPNRSHLEKDWPLTLR